jgi:hypothetical protein
VTDKAVKVVLLLEVDNVTDQRGLQVPNLVIGNILL